MLVGWKFIMDTSNFGWSRRRRSILDSLPVRLQDRSFVGKYGTCLSRHGAIVDGKESKITTARKCAG